MPLAREALAPSEDCALGIGLGTILAGRMPCGRGKRNCVTSDHMAMLRNIYIYEKKNLSR